MMCFSILFLALIFQFYPVNGLLNGRHTFSTISSTTGQKNSDTDILHQLLTQEFLELEKSTRTLIQKVSVLESKNADLERELQQQRAEMNLLQQDNYNLKQTYQQQSTIVAGLRQDLETWKQTTNLLKREVEFSQKNITVLSDCCADNERNVSMMGDRLVLFESSILQQMKTDKEIESGKLSNVSNMVDKLNTQDRYITLSLFEMQLNISKLNGSLSSVVSDMFKNVSSEISMVHRNVIEYVNNSIFGVNTTLVRSTKDALSMASSIQSLNSSFYNFVSEQRSGIGFTTLLHDDVTVHEGQTIKCTMVKNNYGSLYDSNTGIFKTDRSGLFMFFFSVECLNGKVGINLLRDGYMISEIFCQADSQYKQAAAVAVTSLSSGSAVWMKVTGTPTSQIHGKTTFVGVQIN